MRKSLVIISFAFIFLLSMTFVSAGFFDWLTGKPTGDAINQDLNLPPVSQKTKFGDFLDNFFGGGGEP